MIYIFNIILPVLLLMSLITGCASEPVAMPIPEKSISGDQMQRDSEGIAKLGKRWQEGKSLVERGQNMEREAQKNLESARDMISEGQKIMRESEEGYKSIKQ